MKIERYNQLSGSDNWQLNPAEIELGWHWCHEFDGLLVGPGMGELNFCACWPKGHAVYLTAPPDESLTIDEGLL